MELSLEDLRRAWALLPVVKVKQMCRDGGVLALEHPKDLGFFCSLFTKHIAGHRRLCPNADSGSIGQR